MNKEKSEYIAFLTKGENELLGKEDRARIVINEKFVIQVSLRPRNLMVPPISVTTYETLMCILLFPLT